MKNSGSYLLYQDLSELPIYNWYNFAKTMDGIWLRKGGSGIPPLSEVEACYLRLQQQYIDTFGVDANTSVLMALIKRKIVLTADLIEGNNFAKNQIKIVEQEMSRLIPTGTDNGTLEASMVAISKFMGYRVDPKEVSVIEFHEIINLMDKHNGRKTDTEK